MFRKDYDDKEVECIKCQQKVKPLIKQNRTKTEFYRSTFTGKDKTYWFICPQCKTVICTK